MTSILTNLSAMSALQTLRTISSGLQKTQDEVSSGLRVATAFDNVAYWSISTAMRSDNKAVSAASDALGVGAAKVDVAYAGMEAVINILDEFKANLVTAKESSVDKVQIQGELDQLKKQVVGIAQSASFNRENWLNTDIEDINDSDLDVATVVSSYVRDSSGSASVNMMTTHLADIALFNSTGGGLLEADSRKMKTLGGVRLYDTYMDTEGLIWASTTNTRVGTEADLEFTFSGPLVFDDVDDVISFDITVDADDPDILDGPYEPGKTSSIKITRGILDAYDATYSKNLNGIIADYEQYISVLNYVLSGSGASSHYNVEWDSGLQRYINKENSVGIQTNETSGLDGSYVGISNFYSNVGPAALYDTSDYGARAQSMSLNFQEFQLYKDGENPDGVSVNFSFSVNGKSAATYSFDRAYVNELLGKDNGKVETTDEMVTLLQSLMSEDWPNVIIEATNGSQISIRSDIAGDRLQGDKTSIGFTNISVSIEPLSELNFLDIDIASNPDMLAVYTSYVELVTADVVNAAAVLGSLKQRIDMQTDFASKLVDNISSGVSRLVDADMEEASARLQALQTQQQLAVQSLQIVNSQPETILQLFN